MNYGALAISICLKKKCADKDIADIITCLKKVLVFFYKY